jgi:hypothetical protein
MAKGEARSPINVGVVLQEGLTRLERREEQPRICELVRRRVELEMWRRAAPKEVVTGVNILWQ